MVLVVTDHPCLLILFVQLVVHRVSWLPQQGRLRHAPIVELVSAASKPAK